MLSDPVNLLFDLGLNALADLIAATGVGEVLPGSDSESIEEEVEQESIALPEGGGAKDSLAATGMAPYVCGASALG